MKALLGKKIGMTQVFADDALIPVTVIEAGPCHVTQIKKLEKEGYEAVQIGYGEVKDKNLTKPQRGHFQKSKAKPVRYIAEYRLKKGEETPELGSAVSCEVFQVGELTTVTSVSKGKGFQGVIKRWGFAGGPGGHGSHFHRTPGSIGMAATPSRVFKGTKMAGRMGGSQVTMKNLEVIKVDTQQNLILVKGAVPGGKGALLMIKATGKAVKKPVKLMEVGAETEAPPETVKKEKSKEPEVGSPKSEEVKKTAENKKVEVESKEEKQSDDKAEIAERKEEKEHQTQAQKSEEKAEGKVKQESKEKAAEKQQQSKNKDKEEKKDNKEK